jgi:MoxR-like ATPase
MKQLNFSIQDIMGLDRREFRPDNYILNEELVAAVKVALATRQPLLITGEPGTGKTRLAYKIADELAKQDAQFLGEPLVFNTKTTSTAQDLFYVYDTLRHFHDANIRKVAGEEAPDATAYIRLQALGEAIARTNVDELNKQRFVGGSPRSSVVLIDEIDKAPRDFTNDILAEIENYRFEIRELAAERQIARDSNRVILVIMTSNSEKNLPEPFLRRCVFYHIPFPSEAQLMEIVLSQFGAQSPIAREELIQHFGRIREHAVRKRPATAELLAWLQVLEMHDFFKDNPDFTRLTNEQERILRFSYSVLIKTREDLAAIEQM